MREYLACGHCGEIVNINDCEDVTIRGRSEYRGGPPIEPDEHYTKCPECDAVHEDWEDADHDFVLNSIGEKYNLRQLIEILEEDRD